MDQLTSTSPCPKGRDSYGAMHESLLPGGFAGYLLHSGWFRCRLATPTRAAVITG